MKNIQMKWNGKWIEDGLLNKYLSNLDYEDIRLADESKCEHGLNIDCCIKCYAKGLKMKKIEKLEFFRPEEYSRRIMRVTIIKINEIIDYLEAEKK